MHGCVINLRMSNERITNGTERIFNGRVTNGSDARSHILEECPYHYGGQLYIRDDSLTSNMNTM
eukprot:Awhi_evm1s12333